MRVCWTGKVKNLVHFIVQNEDAIWREEFKMKFLRNPSLIPLDGIPIDLNEEWEH